MADVALKTIADKLDSAKRYVERCLRSAKSEKVFCLVEGELDKRIYQKCLNDIYIEVCIANDDTNKAGYARVMEYVGDLRNEYPSARVIGIRDKDYSILLGTPYPDGVFHTDSRDIEMSILTSSSFIASDNTIQSKMADVCPYCKYLAFLRIYNEWCSIGCKINKHVKISLVYDSVKHQYYRDWQDRLNKKFEENSIIKSIQDILDFISNNKLQSYKDRDLCRGHDVVSLMGIIFGNQYHKNEMEKKMLSVYSKMDFYGSNLFYRIQSYCESLGIDANAIKC